MKWESSSKESLPPVWRPTCQGECPVGTKASTASSGCSTMDAVNRVREMSRAMVSRGGVALAVSLDIVNAFKTIPWGGILETLEFFEVPPYIIRVIRAYLSDRWVGYTGKDAEGR
ncbi:uncharacterized protein [Bombus flavifrons]|uniref:uncharacterized protein n=1 Tax=Bombus flavifrons TaxID=103934 RepID=UPI003703A671